MAMEKHFIQEGIIRSEIENYLKNELSRSGYSGINIQKTPLATRVILYVEKPPLVIGKKGKRINRLTKVLKEKYGVDNPAIDVQRIESPTLDANIVARRIAVALERGMNRRRIIYKALRAVMGCGARGIEITLRGKIVGKGGRSRTEKYSQGYMKKAGDSSKLVNTGSTQAYLKAGVIGVTVKLVRPDVLFPDQIEVISKEAKKEEGKEEKEETKKTEAKEEKEETKKTEAKEDKGKKKEAKEEKKAEKEAKKSKSEKKTTKKEPKKEKSEKGKDK